MRFIFGVTMKIAYPLPMIGLAVAAMIAVSSQAALAQASKQSAGTQPTQAVRANGVPVWDKTTTKPMSGPLTRKIESVSVSPSQPQTTQQAAPVQQAAPKQQQAAPKQKQVNFGSVQVISQTQTPSKPKKDQPLPGMGAFFNDFQK